MGQNLALQPRRPEAFQSICVAWPVCFEFFFEIRFRFGPFFRFFCVCGWDEEEVMIVRGRQPGPRSATGKKMVQEKRKKKQTKSSLPPTRSSRWRSCSSRSRCTTPRCTRSSPCVPRRGSPRSSSGRSGSPWPRPRRTRRAARPRPGRRRRGARGRRCGGRR